MSIPARRKERGNLSAFFESVSVSRCAETGAGYSSVMCHCTAQLSSLLAFTLSTLGADLASFV